MLPYLAGLFFQGADARFGWYSWLGYNLDDVCVYLSWMRQAADGHIFQRNLFTTASQSGHQINLFFLLLGNISRFTRLPLIFTFHASRIILGIAFLRCVWWLLEMWLSDFRARKIAFLFVCFSAGLGWVPGLWHQDGVQSPVDVWQPEAITYLCLYLSPLFLVSLLLMVGVLGWLWIGEQKKSIRAAGYAGACGFLLGNIHTYDVITLTAIWGAFLLVMSVINRRLDAGSWTRAIIAVIPTFASSGYTYYLLKTDEVFAKRVAVETLSPAFALYVLGYGLIFVLALIGLRLIATRARGCFAPLHSDDNRQIPWSAIFVIVWTVANIAVAYLPVSFNRKMLMGTHIPLSMLAGVALCWVLRNLKGRVWTIAVTCAVSLLSLTNVRFMLRDMRNFADNHGQSGIQRPFMYSGEIASLSWLREHAPSGAAIQPLPWIARAEGPRVRFFDTTVAAFAPGITALNVNAGHWGETPDFGNSMGLWMRFVLPTTTDEWRIQLLRDTGVKYLLFSQNSSTSLGSQEDADLLVTFTKAIPNYLHLILEASNRDSQVYEVLLP